MIVPILTYNCIVNLNLTRPKVNKLTSLDNRAKMILGRDISLYFPVSPPPRKIMVRAIRVRVRVNPNPNPNPNSPNSPNNFSWGPTNRKVPVSPLLNRIHKHAVLVVEKCLTGKVCFRFSKYFILIWLIILDLLSLRIIYFLGIMESHTYRKVKLVFARSGFFFIGVRIYNSLPLEIRRTLNTGFRNKVIFHFMK